MEYQPNEEEPIKGTVEILNTENVEVLLVDTEKIKEKLEALFNQKGFFIYQDQVVYNHHSEDNHTFSEGEVPCKITDIVLAEDGETIFATRDYFFEGRGVSNPSKGAQYEFYDEIDLEEVALTIDTTEEPEINSNEDYYNESIIFDFERNSSDIEDDNANNSAMPVSKVEYDSLKQFELI